MVSVWFIHNIFFLPSYELRPAFGLKHSDSCEIKPKRPYLKHEGDKVPFFVLCLRGKEKTKYRTGTMFNITRSLTVSQHTGYHMCHLPNIQSSTLCPHIALVRKVWFSHKILIGVCNTDCVYWEVGTRCSNICYLEFVLQNGNERRFPSSDSDFSCQRQ